MWQGFVVDFNSFASVLGAIAIRGDDAENGIPLEAHLIGGEGVISVGCNPSIGGAMRNVVAHCINSAAVITATTPGMECARSKPTERMRACACGDRTKWACSAPDTAISSTYCALPCEQPVVLLA